MKFTIGTQPQTLFLDGEQSNVTLINDGPFTIYLDENGSVSADSSMPLPPLASVPWRANRPLWVVASGNYSTLRMARTDAAPVTPGDGKQRLLYQNLDPMPRSLTSRIETGSYQSLFVSYIMDTALSTDISFDWYSTDGVFLRTTRYQPGTTSAAMEFRLTIPVFGAFCVIATRSGGNFTALSVAGSTTAFEASLYPEFGGAPDDVPIHSAAGGISLLSYGYDYAQFSWDIASLRSVRLQQRGTRLAMNLHFSALPSETGTIELRDSLTGFRIGPSIDIVATSANYDQEWVVPLSIGYTLVVTNVVATPANPVVTLVWSH